MRKQTSAVAVVGGRYARAMDDTERIRRKDVLASIIRELGEDRFRRACEYFRSRAVDPMVSWSERSVAEDEDLESVPHEVTPFFDEEPMPSDWERVNLLMDLFDELPAYWLTCEAGFYYRDLSEVQRRQVWRRFRDWVSEEAWTRSCAAAYSLHVDLFEESPWTEEVWSELLAGEPSRLLVHRVVANSGAAPWSLKVPLYRKLMADKSQHGPMASALYNCMTNYFGKRDETEVRAMTAALRVPAGTLEARMLEDLRARFAQDEGANRGGSHGA